MTPEPKAGRLIGAIANYGLGSYVPQLVNFVLVPVYSRFIAPADQGSLELAFSLQTIFAVLMRMGLPGAVGRLYFDALESPQKRRDLITTVALMVTVLSLVLGAVGVLVGYF